jgi:hypothetical protein
MLRNQSRAVSHNFLRRWHPISPAMVASIPRNSALRGAVCIPSGQTFGRTREAAAAPHGENDSNHMIASIALQNHFATPAVTGAFRKARLYSRPAHRRRTSPPIHSAPWNARPCLPSRPWTPSPVGSRVDLAVLMVPLRKDGALLGYISEGGVGQISTGRSSLLTRRWR